MQEDLDVQAARRTPAYRAGVWSFRVMLLVLVMHISLLFVYGGTYGDKNVLWFLVAYCVSAVTGYICFGRAGIRIVGYSAGIWSRRRLVYRDVLGIGRR